MGENSLQIESFIDSLWIEKGLSKNSLDSYSRDLNLFLKYLDKSKIVLNDVTRAEIMEFMSFRLSKGLSAKTVSRNLSVIKAFFGYLESRNLIQSNPTKDIESPKLPRKLPNTLTEQQINDLLDAPDEKTNLGFRDKTMLVDNAMLYLNTPYLWGGRTTFGIDCSGFTQMIYRLYGKEIPRDAYQQAEIGTTLSFIEESEAGDLAFFDNNEGKIIHVGIILENNFIIHASGKVRIDRLDQQGIFNNEKRKHTHKLRIIKSII